MADPSLRALHDEAVGRHGLMYARAAGTEEVRQLMTQCRKGSGMGARVRASQAG